MQEQFINGVASRRSLEVDASEQKDDSQAEGDGKAKPSVQKRKGKFQDWRIVRHFRSDPRFSTNSTKLNCSISDRKISGQSTNLSDGTLEIDSHADTTLHGNHFLGF